MQAVCSASTSFKGISLARQTTRASTRRPAVQAPVAQQNKLAARVAAASVALPALVAHPAFALVDERLNGDGTGKILGIAANEGFVIFGVFALIWTLYYGATRELGGDAGDDSGLSL
ncbi:hypothetical protein WJX72_005547 [[Myrmecia] bisecta]|uniref:PSII 6.1 kDa protein n=1 Tax=[Myrmecia] bisecta TaxID=41462 RepID=A0AAW1R6P1_9CHLO